VGLGRLDDRQDLGSTELAELDCSHRVSPMWN
jgi:hypothetical protein